MALGWDLLRVCPRRVWTVRFEFELRSTPVRTRVRTRVLAEIFFREGWGEGGFQFSSSSCLGGRATGGGAVRVRVQSEFEGGVDNASSNSQIFFPGGRGVSSSVRVRAELTMDLLIPIAIGFVWDPVVAIAIIAIPEISWNHLFDGFLLQLPSPHQYRLYFIVYRLVLSSSLV